MLRAALQLGERVRLASCGMLRPPARLVTGGVERWWQPILPALAAEVAPLTDGRGRSRKKFMQRKQQIVSMHARRKEGIKRNQVIRQQRLAESRQKVADVYEKFARILQREAASVKGPPS